MSICCDRETKKQRLQSEELKLAVFPPQFTHQSVVGPFVFSQRITATVYVCICVCSSSDVCPVELRDYHSLMIVFFVRNKVLKSLEHFALAQAEFETKRCVYIKLSNAATGTATGTATATELPLELKCHWNRHWN